MTELPAELQPFGSLLAAQPLPVQEAFHYCLCLMMVEAGSMTLIETTPSDDRTLYHFQTANGEAFVVPHPGITPEQETEVRALLREIMEDEGLM